MEKILLKRTVFFAVLLVALLALSVYAFNEVSPLLSFFLIASAIYFSIEVYNGVKKLIK
jgi:hypothetical protein